MKCIDNTGNLRVDVLSNEDGQCLNPVCMGDNMNSEPQTVKVLETKQMTRNVMDSSIYCSKSRSNDVTMDAAAVQTRSQVQKGLTPLKPLKLTKFYALNLSVAEFKNMQKAGSS